MPSFARREMVVEGEVGTYHCIARCVRRAFLCGFDPLSNRSFDHRKDWIQRRLEELAGIFAIDIIGFAVMGNHLHLILRQRPDLAASWSDDDVAGRWIRLHPKRGATATTMELERTLVKDGCLLLKPLAEEWVSDFEPPKRECQR